jgi:hypothetical protein
MTPVQADLVYHDLRATGDGSFIACGPMGWQSARAGDQLNFGGGTLVEILGPSQIGGGSFKLGGAVLLGGMVLMAVAGMLGFGKT